MRPRARRRRESVLERWAVGVGRNMDWTVSKVTDPTGFPDHVFWLPSGPLIVEFKRVDGRTDKGREELQRWHRRKLACDGYRVHVVKTKEEFLRLIENERSGTVVPTK